jgi:hypothetical protein
MVENWSQEVSRVLPCRTVLGENAVTEQRPEIFFTSTETEIFELSAQNGFDVLWIHSVYRARTQEELRVSGACTLYDRDEEAQYLLSFVGLTDFNKKIQ